MKVLLLRKIFIATVLILLQASVFAGQNFFEVAYETSSYTYKEPHMDHPISLKSTKQGVSAIYKRYGIWDSKIPDATYGLIEIRYMTGDNTYRGWVSDGGGIYIPLEAPDIRDYYYEGAIKVGTLIYQKDNLNMEAGLGLGYRFLKDHLENIGLGGYLRESNYLYMPIELKANYKINEYFKIALNTELDYLLSGEQYSGEIMGYDVSEGVRHSQDQGYGLRASLRFSALISFAEVFVEPFWRYWHIQNSEKEYQYVKIGGTWYQQLTYEPFNTTQEYGIKVGVAF